MRRTINIALEEAKFIKEKFLDKYNLINIRARENMIDLSKIESTIKCFNTYIYFIVKISALFILFF